VHNEIGLMARSTFGGSSAMGMVICDPQSIFGERRRHDFSDCHLLSGSKRRIG
jgi:hypothetical protein